jgi:fructokinase
MSLRATTHEVVCFGEILWDILPDQSLPGGAPMNVAYHLKKLGLHPALVSRVGDDEYGKQLVELLASNKINNEYVQVDPDHTTGLVYAQIGQVHEVTYDIVYPSAWDYIQWNIEYERLLQEATYFVYGSLSTRDKTSRNTLYQLMEGAKTKVLDINLRAPHYTQEIVETLLNSADILKLNEAELQIITAWYGAPLQRESQIQLLQERFRINTVIVTMGGEGAMVASGNAFYYNGGYKIQVADTIGSGDAFLAGFLYQLYHKAPLQTALDFAAALGALIATYNGACPSYDTSQIAALMKANERSAI